MGQGSRRRRRQMDRSQVQVLEVRPERCQPVRRSTTTSLQAPATTPRVTVADSLPGDHVPGSGTSGWIEEQVPVVDLQRPRSTDAPTRRATQCFGAPPFPETRQSCPADTIRFEPQIRRQPCRALRIRARAVDGRINDHARPLARQHPVVRHPLSAPLASWRPSERQVVGVDDPRLETGRSTW